MATNTKRRFIVLLAATICCGTTGAVYIWSIYNIPLMEAKGWSQTEVAFAYSFYLVMVCLTGFVCGWLQKRVNPRPLTLIAGTLFGLGFILTSFAQNIPQLYFFFSIIGGTGNGFIYNTAVTTAQRWYPDKRGLASGLCIGGAGLAPVIFAPLGNYFIEAFSVTTSFLIVGIIIVVLYWIFASLLRVPEPGWKPEGWEPPAELGESNCISDLKTPQMLKQPLFWCMWLVLMSACTSGTMMTGNASNIGQELADLTASEGALLVSLMAVGNFAGRFGFASLSDKIGRHATLIIMLAINCVVMLFLLPNAHSFLTFTACILVIGACFGGSMATMASLCGDNFGTANYGQNYAFLYSGFTMSSFTGSALAAACFQAMGSYSLAFTVAGVLPIVAIILVLACRKLEKNLQVKNIHNI